MTSPTEPPTSGCTFTTTVGTTTYLCVKTPHADRPNEHWLRSAREVAFGREHAVTLANHERVQLANFALHPNGSKHLGPRLVVEAVAGGGLVVRTRPYTHGEVPR